MRIKTALALMFLVLASLAQAHGISDADKQAIADGGNLRYLWLGANHMVTGYDHLLFLFGVLFYLKGIKDILKFITAFTLGHSITLVLATFLKITADYHLVDAVIALSICYKAFDNLDGFRKWLGMGSPNLVAMVFLFGLIHGFGLSTRLQELPLPSEGLLTRILSFNVGVELGQVAALSVLVALLAGWRRTSSFQRLGGIANGLLLVAGLGLFGWQLNGYFRGGDPHHGETHGPAVPELPHKEGGHFHGEAGHSHEDGHSHGDAEHSHDAAPAHDAGDEAFSPLRPAEPGDSTAGGAAAPVPDQEHGHNHGDGHDQGHSHDHGTPHKH
jgi:hypothetical protein